MSGCARSAFPAAISECMCVWQAAVAKVNVSSHTIANSQNLCAIHSNHCTIYSGTQIGSQNHRSQNHGVTEHRLCRTCVLVTWLGGVGHMRVSYQRFRQLNSSLTCIPVQLAAHFSRTECLHTASYDIYSHIFTHIHCFADRQSTKSRRPSTSTKVARHNQTSKF